MISSVLALLLYAAPPPPLEAIAKARRDYSACLSAFMKKTLKEPIAVDAFNAAIGPGCSAQEQAFRTVLVAADTAAGIKRATAEQNAASEVQDMLSNTEETYRDAKGGD